MAKEEVSGMSERRGGVIERILQRIEDRVEEYRERDRARQADLAAHRAELWAEAAERQRLLAEAMAEGEADRGSMEEITRERRVVFVLHREELTGTLEAFAAEKACLVNTSCPARGTTAAAGASRASGARGWCSRGRRRSRRRSGRGVLACEE